jgi:hypothetical protein
MLSKLALQRKMIDSQDKTLDELQKYIEIPMSLKEHLFLANWYKSESGILDTIKKLEAHLCHFPMELDFFYGKFIYEILVYLNLSIGDYKRAKTYNSLIPDFFKTIPNKQKVHELMLNFARVEFFLQKNADITRHQKSNGILKIMNASGVSFDIEERWMNIGNENSENPFGYCDFNCDDCSEHDDICVWKKVNVEEMV